MPDALREQIELGRRVKVPLGAGNRLVVGYCVRLEDRPAGPRRLEAAPLGPRPAQPVVAGDASADALDRRLLSLRLGGRLGRRCAGGRPHRGRHANGHAALGRCRGGGAAVKADGSSAGGPAIQWRAAASREQRRGRPLARRCRQASSGTRQAEKTLARAGRSAQGAGRRPRAALAGRAGPRSPLRPGAHRHAAAQGADPLAHRANRHAAARRNADRPRKAPGAQPRPGKGPAARSSTPSGAAGTGRSSSTA